MHVPVWWLEKPLPVDLCVEVTFRVETGEEFKGYPLIVHKGTTSQGGYFLLRKDALVEGRSGFVPVRLVLMPSRAMALMDPKVTRYIPGEIVTEVLRMKIGPQVEAGAPLK